MLERDTNETTHLILEEQSNYNSVLSTLSSPLVNDEIVREEISREKIFLQRDTTDPFSLIVAFLCVFTGDMVRGVLLPTLWFYVEFLKGNQFLLGCVISSFSLGRIISAPIIGKFSEIHGYRRVLIVCNILIFLGAILFMFSFSIITLIFAEFIMGIGAGSLGAVRSYVAETTVSHKRTEFIAYVTALQYAGFMGSPILGGITFHLAERFHLFKDERFFFTFPSINLMIASIGCVFLLITLFKDVERDPFTQEQIKSLKRKTKNENSLEIIESDNPDNNKWRKIMEISGCFLNFITKGTISIFETSIIFYLYFYYHWDQSESGVLISILGIIGVMILLMFKYLMFLFSDTDLIIIGVFLMNLSVLLLIHYNNSHFSSGRLIFALFLMLSLGYPVGHTALIGVYSRILKSGPQGSKMGIFGSWGSIARIIFPMITGTLIHNYGFNLPLELIELILFFVIIFLLFSRKIILSFIQE